MSSRKKILIAGQNGMVGRAIKKNIDEKTFRILNCSRRDLDLTDQKKVKLWFKKNKPDIVINAAGKVGGILDNSNYKSDYIYVNLMIGLNLLTSSVENNIKTFINLGSSCIYPKHQTRPIKETDLLKSKLEETNEAYALAKISILKYCSYINRAHKDKNYITLLPANLYGEGDNFDLKSSHVIPALVRKLHEAKQKKKKIVNVWGSGLSKREFMHVDDLGSAINFCLNRKVKNDLINISSGEHVSIRFLVKKINKIVGYDGKINYDRSKLEGVKYRKLNNDILKSLGWRAKIKLKEGLVGYYEYFKKI